MASEYRINLEAQLSEKQDRIRQQIKDLEQNVKLNIDLDVSKGDIDNIVEIKRRFDEIRETTDRLAQMTAETDPLGVVDQYTLDYMDKFKNKYKEIYRLVTVPLDKPKMDEQGNLVEFETKWMMTSAKVVDGIAARQKEINSLREKDSRISEKIALSKSREADQVQKILDRSTLYAQKFLERSKGLQQTGQVTQASGVAQNIIEAASKRDVEGVKELTRQLSVLDAGIRQSGHSAWSFSEQLKTAMVRTFEYATSIGVVYGALNQLKGGLQYLADLNKQMVNIQIATGLTSSQTTKLAQDYNDLGKEIGATTIEVAQSAVTWLKQGKNVEESNELIRGSVMLAKLGLLETGEAAEYLTSTLNGYKFEVEDIQSIISKLVAVDNASATSVAELSKALSRSANIARESGVSFEFLLASIGTVSSVTRRSAESVGFL